MTRKPLIKSAQTELKSISCYSEPPLGSPEHRRSEGDGSDTNGGSVTAVHSHRASQAWWAKTCSWASVSNFTECWLWFVRFFFKNPKLPWWNLKFQSWPRRCSSSSMHLYRCDACSQTAKDMCVYSENILYFSALFLCGSSMGLRAAVPQSQWRDKWTRLKRGYIFVLW